MLFPVNILASTTVTRHPLNGLLSRSTCVSQHTKPFYGSLAFVRDNPGWAGTRKNIHPLTPIVVISHPLSASSNYHDPLHPPCSSLFPQSLTKFSLVYPLAWHPQLHSSYISSPSTSVVWDSKYSHAPTGAYQQWLLHYYNHFTALRILSRTTWISRYQKGKTNLDLPKQEIVSGSGISWAIC